MTQAHNSDIFSTTPNLQHLFYDTLNYDWDINTNNPNYDTRIYDTFSTTPFVEKTYILSLSSLIYDYKSVNVNDGHFFNIQPSYFNAYILKQDLSIVA